jgi:serine/threonine protein kinase
MALTSGNRVGPYEILAAVGAGGMGEVHRARDSKLGRDVAIKVLPEAFAREALTHGAEAIHVPALLNQRDPVANVIDEDPAEFSNNVLAYDPIETKSDRSRKLGHVVGTHECLDRSAAQ